MSAKLTKRQRLILRATVVVLLVSAACVIAYPYLGIDPPPSTRHSRRMEGITDRLARNLPEDHPRRGAGQDGQGVGLCLGAVEVEGGNAQGAADLLAEVVEPAVAAAGDAIRG